jgi:hypothetical protein
MQFNIDPVDLGILLFGAAGFLAVLAFVLLAKYRARREKQDIAAVSLTIVEYFRRSGVEVAVGSVSLQSAKRFTAFIESEPMKRFRLSHIIEATLREHVQRTCGLELEKVYWRFPIKEATRNTSKESKPGEETDDYINEGLVHYKHLPKVEVTELSWENFEAVTTIQLEAKTAAEEPQKTDAVQQLKS